MKTKTKALALFLSAVLLVVTTVFATMAFLTSEDSVKNTFTFGKVVITLDEADVNEKGVVEKGGDRTATADRVKENIYHLIPNHYYVKDPTIHVDEDSETCWLFVKLNNGLKGIIAGKTSYDESDNEAETVYTIEAQMVKNGWSLIDSDKNIWAYKATADKGADVPVFDSFKLTETAMVENFGGTKDADGKVTNSKATIEVIAYAVQADGFETAQAAWTAANGSFEN